MGKFTYRLILIGPLLLGTLSTAPGAPPAAGEQTRAEELIKAARDWVGDNIDIDPSTLDLVKIKSFWHKLLRNFEGEYVIDLAAFKGEAQTILTILENFESAAPYAVWLRTRLDYFDVADQIKLTVQPPSIGSTPPVRAPTPPAITRRIWNRQIEQKPAPIGAQNYVDRLKPIFTQAGVPAELVWLAEVESSFNPAARSPVGAVGLFQFMPATARQYGLALEPEDERTNPEKSARAAATYLRYLHKRFENWPLALAAYNAGEGRVARLLRATEGRTFDDIAARLPSETQLYVPKVEATILKRENIALR